MCAMAIEWSEDIVVCDLQDEPELSEELQSLLLKLQDAGSGATPDVVLNLGSISYLNSSNIAQLLRVRKHLVENDANLRLCAVQDAVWSIMLLTGLDKVFHFAPDKPTAIASLQIEKDA